MGTLFFALGVHLQSFGQTNSCRRLFGPTAGESVISHFLDIAKIPRESGHEELVRAHLIEIAQRQGLRWQVDAAGNLTVEVDATNGAKNTKKRIALQSHLDMVLAATDEKLSPKNAPSVTLQNIFRNGVPEMKEVDGWLQGVGTTLGADNGMGVAMMARYMTDPDLPHPPLTLIFTVEEETGTIGAAKYKLPEGLGVLLNLDGEEFGTVWNACQGACRVEATHQNLKAVEVPASFAKLQLKLSGFAGGHSGLDIHLGRGHAVKILADFLALARLKFPEILVMRASSGDAINKIPSSFVLEIAAPQEKLQAIEEFRKLYLSELIRSYHLAENADVPLEETPIQLAIAVSHSQGKLAISPHQLDLLIENLEAIPVGVLERRDGPGFSLGINLTSNIGYFELNQVGDDFTSKYGVMPRAFLPESLETHTADVVHRIRSSGLGGALTTGDLLSPPWAPLADSWLLELFHHTTLRNGLGQFQVDGARGGLETARFSVQDRTLPMLSFGPDIHGPHAPGEKVRIDSINASAVLLDALLIDIGQDPHFGS